MCAWLYKQKGSKNWWVGYRAAGKQFLKSTETADRDEALKKLAETELMLSYHRKGSFLEQVYHSLVGAEAPKSPTLKLALGLWIDEAERTTKPRTLEKYQTFQRQLIDYLKATDDKPLVSEITPDVMRGFLTFQGKTKSAGTVNLTRKIAAVFFRPLLHAGTIRVNPVAGIKSAKESNDVVSRRAFTLVEVALVRSKCPNDFWRYMVTAGFYTGQRMGDLACLRRSNVDLQHNFLRLVASKTSKSMKIPIAAPLLALIQARLKEMGAGRPTDYLWPDYAALYQRSGSRALSAEFYEILAACGLVAIRENKQGTGKGRSARRDTNALSFHCLRHTCVTLLKITGANQSTAKELAGHSSDQVSDAYTHMPEATLREAINNLPEI